MQHAPQVVNWATYDDERAKPRHFTPMMCLVDSPTVQSEQAEENFTDMVVWLMSVMEPAALHIQGGRNRANFMHMICGRGRYHTAERIISFFEQGRFPHLDKESFISLLNAKNTAGKGVVDVSLSCKGGIARLLKDFGAVEQAPDPRYEEQQAAAQASGRDWQPSDDWQGKEPRDWNKGWSDDYKKRPASGRGGKGKGSTRHQSGRGSSSSSGAWGPASGQDATPEPQMDWSQGWNWGSQRKARGPDYDPAPGSWDHRGTPAELRGLGIYAYDKKNRRVEEDMSVSSLSDTSQGPMEHVHE